MRTFAIAAAALISASAFGQTGPVVTVAAGKLSGTDEQGVASWKGIPFAAAPIGDLRWRAPQPVAHWQGVKAATAYGHDCMQEPFPSDAAPLGTPPAENCLYANVWKHEGAKAKLPVIVWIYGGGFLNGGSSPPTYSGANLAKKGVLVFSFNYRVGRFGFFAHPALTRANADKGLFGNYGFLDQIAALKWVRANIAAFGGDPANVTIMGESAGGYSVHALLSSPLSQGLFQRAIIMSGGGGASLGTGDLAAAEKVGIAFAATKGIKADDPQALAKLRALSAQDMTSGLNMTALWTVKPEDRTFLLPYVDGKIAVDGLKAYASGEFGHVPVVIGATSDDVGGKLGFAAQARHGAVALSGQGVPVYQYRFSYVADSIGKMAGAAHATDIPYFLDTQAIKYGAATTARDNRMGDVTSSYIVNFAKTGDPNGAGLPVWQRYSVANEQILDLAADGSAIPQRDPWAEDMAKVPVPQN